MEKSFSLLYFLKQSGNEPKKYIYLRITVDGHPVELSTKKQWWESRWDQEKGRASGVKQDAQEVNFFLDTIENKVFKSRKQLIEDEELITAELLRGHAYRQSEPENDPGNLRGAQSANGGTGW